MLEEVGVDEVRLRRDVSSCRTRFTFVYPFRHLVTKIQEKYSLRRGTCIRNAKDEGYRRVLYERGVVLEFKRPRISSGGLVGGGSC